MNEELNQIINKVDETILGNDLLTEEIKKEFNTVKIAQKEVNEKLSNLNKQINNTLLDLNENIKKVIDEFSQRTKILFLEFNTESAKKTDELNNDKAKYDKVIHSLIDDVNKKTAKVMEFEGGISKIEKDVENYLSQIEKRWKNNEEKIDNILKQLKDDTVTELLSTMSKQIEVQSLKIEKLEKFSHTHTFGGKKV